MNAHAPRTLATDVKARTGLNVAQCYQCGKCSAGCPMAAEGSLRPHDVMRMAMRNERGRLATDESIWLCLTCETCTTRCPNECDPARVIDALRELAMESGDRGPRAIGAFHKSFLGQVRSHGRMFEMGLIAAYKLRSGKLFADVLASPGMLSRGKLSMTPHKIAGVDDVRRIFEECESAGRQTSDVKRQAPVAEEVRS